VLTPREIYAVRGITISQIFAGYYHSLAISTSGKVWGWGKNCDSILGMINLEDSDKKSNHKGIIYTPQELTVNKNLQKISGEELKLQEDFFNKSDVTQLNIQVTDTTKVKSIACGGSHTLAITTGGEAYAWGYGADV
jgi:alpha-tubulin suppressor-like RCC1 family protein